MRLLLTPGHTPGHQSVAVGETLVIGGDVVHFASGLDDKRYLVILKKIAPTPVIYPRRTGMPSKRPLT